ncbi:MAG: hypothetical protein K940chlam9_00221 [Chlamydiae bacterium]|nr:hypothetical protein [Chlamydiota bacterium]
MKKSPFPWALYSKKMGAKIEKSRSAGFFTAKEAEERQMRFVMGREGGLEEGNEIAFYWLVDLDGGVILDAKYQAFGNAALYAAAEALCELLIGKNYDQAKRISADLIDKHLRDHSETPAFPEETAPFLNLVLEAADKAAEQCLDLPLSASYVSPLPRDSAGKEGTTLPDWSSLSKEQRISLIEELLDEEIRPYIALDAGGITLEDLKNESEVHISYQGSCTSCHSAVGSTLSAIQEILQTKLNPSLTVIPNLDDLNF